MKNLVSVSENSFYFRVFVLIVGLLIIFILNYLFIAYFLWYKYGFELIFLLFFLWILFWLLMKKFKYIYRIKDNKLIIKTSSKAYEVPLSEIRKVDIIDNIPVYNKLWINFDVKNKNLYLCGWTSKWIIIQLDTHNLVICPRKFNDFLFVLKEKIWK